MRKLIVTALIGVAQPTSGYTVIGFERINPAYPTTNYAQVLGFYDGGTSSAGTAGMNYGFAFDANAVAICLNRVGGSCSNASAGGLQPTSSRGALGLAADGQAVLDIAGGYSGPVAFRYAVAPGSVASIALYSGLGGTGTQLAVVPLFPAAAGCAAYNAAICPLAPGGLGAAGILSVVFSGEAGRVVWDDLTFGAGNDPLPPPAVLPEPASWILLTGGLAAVGTRLRRRRGSAVVA